MNPPRSDEFRLDNLDAAAGLNEEKETLLQEADDAHEAAMELSRTPLAAVAALKAVAVDAMASELAEALPQERSQHCNVGKRLRFRSSSLY